MCNFSLLGYILLLVMIVTLINYIVIRDVIDLVSSKMEYLSVEYMELNESTTKWRNICGYYDNNEFMNNVDIDIFDEDNYIYNLSIIIGTRNDNYGGHLLLRLTTVLGQYLSFPWYNKYGLNVEIIITEFNYIPTNIHVFEEPLFIDMINRLNVNNIDIKFILVPYNETKPLLFHLNTTVYCPMLEFVAKNIALRYDKYIYNKFEFIS